MVYIHIDAKGLDELILSTKRVSKPGLPFEVTTKLEAALEKGFAETQVWVHVETERLKLSGTTESTVRGSTWSGKITYGGGPEKVYWGIYELARGGKHNFFAPLETPLIDNAFEEAVDEFFRPLKGL